MRLWFVALVDVLFVLTGSTYALALDANILNLLSHPPFSPN